MGEKMRVIIHPDIWKWLKPLYEEWLEGEVDKMSKEYRKSDWTEVKKMSEVTKCDQCGKVVPTGEISKRSTITGESGWWKVDSSAFDEEEGADFCSAVCVRNFFADRVIAALPEEKRAKDPHEPVRGNTKTAAETCPSAPSCYKCGGPTVHEIDYAAPAHPGVVLEPDTSEEQETSGAGFGRNGTVPEGVV